jgi:hypothetical protein
MGKIVSFEIEQVTRTAVRRPALQLNREKLQKRLSYWIQRGNIAVTAVGGFP